MLCDRQGVVCDPIVLPWLMHQRMADALVVGEETEIVTVTVVIFTDFVLFPDGGFQHLVVRAAHVKPVPLYPADEVRRFGEKPLDIVAGGAVCWVEFSDGRHEFGRTFQCQFYSGLGDTPQFGKSLPHIFLCNPTTVSDIDKQRAVVVYPHVLRGDFKNDALDRRAPQVFFSCHLLIVFQ